MLVVRSRMLLSAAVAAGLGMAWSQANAANLLKPGDFIIAIDSSPPGITPGTSNSPAGELVPSVIDGNINSKYLNFGNYNSGFIVTPGDSIVQSIVLSTANDSPDRDPTSYQLFGTNDAIVSANHSGGTDENWTPISSGSLSLPDTRFSLGTPADFANATSYSSYKLYFPTLKSSPAANCCMQIAEAQFYTEQGAGGSTVLAPGQSIIAIDAPTFAPQSSFPANENPPLAIDGNVNSKYLNFGKELSGFIVTPSGGPSVATGFVIATANDAIERDPSSYEIYGTNDAFTTPDNGTGLEDNIWTLIASGDIFLPDTRFTYGDPIQFANNESFTSYKVIFPNVKNNGAANSMQISEFQLTDSTVVPVLWRADQSGDWNSQNNWDGAIPVGADAVATFLGVNSQPRTVFTDVTIDVGTINLDSPNSWVITGAGSLNMVTTSGPAFINVVSGQHKISLPINFANDAVIDVAGGAELTLSNPITMPAGITLNKNGDGVLSIITTITADAPGATLKLNGGTTNLEINGGSNLNVVVDPSSLNIGANQTLGNLAIVGGSVVSVGLNRFGVSVDADVTAQGLQAYGGGANVLNTTLAGNAVDAGGLSIGDNTALVKIGPGTLNVTGAQDHGADSLLVTGEGTVNLNSDAGGNLSIVTGALGITNLNSTQHLALLQINEGRVNVAPGGDKVIVVTSVGFSGGTNDWHGKLDLADNAMIVNSASPNADLDTLTNLIATARNTVPSLWQGQGITTSVATSDGPTGLAIILNRREDSNTPLYSTFEGEPVNANSILIKYSWNGDTDLSGQIDADDYFQIDNGFALAGVLAGYRNGDFDYSGAIDADDYFLIDASFAVQSGILSGGVAAVPEPATIGLFAAAAGLLLRRARRR